MAVATIVARPSCLYCGATLIGAGQLFEWAGQLLRSDSMWVHLYDRSPWCTKTHKASMAHHRATVGHPRIVYHIR